jgi:hypothetical protein
MPRSCIRAWRFALAHLQRLVVRAYEFVHIHESNTFFSYCSELRAFDSQERRASQSKPLYRAKPHCRGKPLDRVILSLFTQPPHEGQPSRSAELNRIIEGNRITDFNRFIELNRSIEGDRVTE